MSDTGFLLRQLPQRWRYALVGGVLVLPSTTVGYLQTGVELVFSPVLLGGLLAGYLAERRLGESRGVGIRVGLVGAIPVVWFVFDALVTAWALSGPPWLVVTVTIVTAGVSATVVALGLGLAALVGEVGGRIGGWVAETRPGHSVAVPDL